MEKKLAIGGKRRLDPQLPTGSSFTAYYPWLFSHLPSYITHAIILAVFLKAMGKLK
jgi:hypothetical protein